MPSVLTTRRVILSGGFTGFLNLYPNALAAFSLRRLRSAYYGPLVRVRRSLDNAETNIGFKVNGDLDTDALLNFCGAGDGFVTTWYDQSVTGGNATQTTAANQPTIVSSGALITSYTNKPALSFDGTNDFMIFDSIGSSTRSGFIVMAQDVYDTTNRRRIIGENRFVNSSNNSGYIFEARGEIANDPISLTVQNNLLTQIDSAPNPTIGNAIFSYFINTSVSAFKNGASLLSGAGTMDTNFTEGSIAASRSGTLPMNARYSEIIIYNRNLSSSEDNMKALLNKYWGVY